MNNKNFCVLEKEDFELANDFAEKTYLLHKSHGRDKKEVFKHIQIGKLGEIAFKKIFNELDLSKVNFKVDSCDPGYDFILNKKIKIDVKTLDQNWKQRVFFNKDYLNADFYSLIRINLDLKTAIYFGSITKENLLKFAVFEKDLSWVSSNYFNINCKFE